MFIRCEVERKGYIRGSVACGSHLGLWINLCKASVGKATNCWSVSHGSYPDFLLFFCPRGFLWQVFNRTFIFSGCSAPLSLSCSSVLVFSTCTFFVQNGGHPSLTGMICLCMGSFVQSFGHPSLTGVICLCMGSFVQSCGHPSLTGVIYLCMGSFVQNRGHPSLTGVICLCMGTSVQSSGHPSLTGVICL